MKFNFLIILFLSLPVISALPAHADGDCVSLLALLKDDAGTTGRNSLDGQSSSLQSEIQKAADSGQWDLAHDKGELLVTLAEKELREKGVRTRRAKAFYRGVPWTVLEIKPLRFVSPLNTAAWEWKRDFHGQKTAYAPQILSALFAQAFFYDERDKGQVPPAYESRFKNDFHPPSPGTWLFISTDAWASGQLTAIENDHERQHAEAANDLRKGVSSNLDGAVFTRESEDQGNAYASYLHASEIPAFISSIVDLGAHLQKLYEEYQAFWGASTAFDQARSRLFDEIRKTEGTLDFELWHLSQVGTDISYPAAQAIFKIQNLLQSKTSASPHNPAGAAQVNSDVSLESKKLPDGQNVTWVLIPIMNSYFSLQFGPREFDAKEPVQKQENKILAAVLSRLQFIKTTADEVSNRDREIRTALHSLQTIRTPDDPVFLKIRELAGLVETR